MGFDGKQGGKGENGLKTMRNAGILELFLTVWMCFWLIVM